MEFIFVSCANQLSFFIANQLLFYSQLFSSLILFSAFVFQPYLLNHPFVQFSQFAIWKRRHCRLICETFAVSLNKVCLVTVTLFIDNKIFLPANDLKASLKRLLQWSTNSNPQILPIFLLLVNLSLQKDHDTVNFFSVIVTFAKKETKNHPGNQYILIFNIIPYEHMYGTIWGFLVSKTIRISLRKTLVKKQFIGISWTKCLNSSYLFVLVRSLLCTVLGVWSVLLRWEGQCKNLLFPGFILKHFQFSRLLKVRKFST